MIFMAVKINYDFTVVQTTIVVLIIAQNIVAHVPN